MPHRVPEDMPDRMLEDMPDRMPECMPERMPDKMSDRLPEDMPDRKPEGMPGRQLYSCGFMSENTCQTEQTTCERVQKGGVRRCLQMLCIIFA